MLFASMGLLVFSTAMVTLLQQWRAVGPALVLYSVALAMAHWAALGPAVGVVKLVGGLTAFGILLLSATAEPQVAAATSEPSRWESLVQLFLLGAVALAMVGAYKLTITWPLGGPAVLNFAWYWLAAVGMLVLLAARTLLRMGLGLLLLAGAGEVLQTCLSQTADLTFLGGSALAEVLLALAVVRVVVAARPCQKEGDG